MEGRELILAVCWIGEGKESQTLGDEILLCRNCGLDPKPWRNAILAVLETLT